MQKIIRELAFKFSGRAWFSYDQQFPYARQCSPICWADIHLELYLKVHFHAWSRATRGFPKAYCDEWKL